MATVEERLVKIETTIGHYADEQRGAAQALTKVSESMIAIQLTLERQNAVIAQVSDIRREVEDVKNRVGKIEGKVYWLSGGTAVATFLILNFSRIKDFFN